MNGQVNCPACGTTNTESSRFCKSCGGAVPTAAIPSSVSDYRQAATHVLPDTITPEYQETCPTIMPGASVTSFSGPAPINIENKKSSSGDIVAGISAFALLLFIWFAPSYARHCFYSITISGLFKIIWTAFVALVLTCATLSVVGRWYFSRKLPSKAIYLTIGCISLVDIVLFSILHGVYSVYGLVACVLFSIGIVVGGFLKLKEDRKSDIQSAEPQAIATNFAYQDIIKTIDTQFLSQGWDVKFRTQDQLVYEQKRHGRIWVTILLSLFALVGGILYYFLSDRRESVIYQLTPLPNNQGTKVELNLQDCKRKASQKFALSVMENLKYKESL